MPASLQPGASGVIYDPYFEYEYTSGLGPREIDQGSSNHQGVDRATPSGTRAAALDGGTVTTGVDPGGYGNWVAVLHGYTADGRAIETLTAHLDHVYVQDGQTVGKGDQIGLTGSTGVGTGPHVHVEFLIGGVPYDYTDIVADGGRYLDGVAPGQTAGDPALADGVLQRGEQGQAVYNLQDQLVHAGYGSVIGTPDGDFGPGTEEAVRRFQENRGLTPDGIAGVQTRSELDVVAGSRSFTADPATLVASADPMYVNPSRIPTDPVQVNFVREMDDRANSILDGRVSDRGVEAIRAEAARKGDALTPTDVRAVLERTDPNSGVTGSDLVNVSVALRAVGEMQADPFGSGAAAVHEARSEGLYETMDGPPRTEPGLGQQQAPAPVRVTPETIGPGESAIASAGRAAPSAPEPMLLG